MKLYLKLTLFLAINIAVFSQDFSIINESKLSYEETILKIEETAKSAGWKIPAKHELDKSVKSAGYDVLPVTVIEICNPQLAGKVLEREEARFITPFMPVRFSIYTTSDNKVMIARMNPGLMQLIEDEKLKNLLIESCSSADKLLRDVLK